LDKHNDSARTGLLMLLKIDEKDPKKALKKLKEIPAQDILKANADLFTIEDIFKGEAGTGTKYFSIALDGEFLKEMPSETTRKGKFHPHPYMIGVNNTEGCGMLAVGQDKGFATGISEEDGKTALQGFLNFINPATKDEKVFEAVWKKYMSLFPDENDPFRYSRIVGECGGDCLFSTVSIAGAKSHESTGASTYFYRMTHQSRYSHDKEFQPAEGAVFKSDICECDHGDDIIFTFGIPLSLAKLNLSAKFSDAERSLTEQWMGYLANFATTGNPNEGKYQPKEKWEKFGKDGKHLDVNPTPQMKGDFYGDRYKFWTEDLKKPERKRGTEF